MSDFYFHITPGLLPESLLEKSFLAVWGRSPRPTKITIKEDILTAHTDFRGSCTLHVPFPHQKLGITVASTDSLLSNPQPHGLIRELVRGSLGRLQKRLFEWETTGFAVSDEIRQSLSAASRKYSKAVVLAADTPETEQVFLNTMETLNSIESVVSRQYAEQTIVWRTRIEEKLPVFFGTGTGTVHCDTPYEFGLYSSFLQDAFQVMMPMPSWRELEPEQGQYRWELLEKKISVIERFGFGTALGPMITFNKDAFPLWLCGHLSEDGFFETAATRFVNAVAERFGEQADYWILANRFNSYHIKEIPVPRAVTLVRILSQQLRSRGLQKPLLIGLDRLWGEYAVHSVPEYEPVQIAESLISCREIDSFLLELNFGIDNNSTLPRDPMSISSMLDQWSFLGKKVFVSISVPGSRSSSNSTPEFQWTDELQHIWTEMLLTLLMGKRAVCGVFWSVLQDTAEQHSDTAASETFLSHSGLINSSRVPKPAFRQFADVNNTLLR